MTDDQIRAVMALADAYALTGYSAVSLTLAKAMPQRAALESALRAVPAQALASLTDAQIESMWRTVMRTSARDVPPTAFARAIERAHGIGVEVNR